MKNFILFLIFIFISFGHVSMAEQTVSNPANKKYVEDGVDFAPYMKYLQSTIRSNWFPPKGDKSKRVVMYFKIQKDGKLISNELLVSSGKRKLDKSAIRAVKISAPFKPLPKKFNGNEVGVEFTFDYNVFQKY